MQVLVFKRISLFCLLVFFSAGAVFSQDSVQLKSNQASFVTGVVTNARGLSLAGVSVRKKEGKMLGMSDADGKFSVNINASTAVLVFSEVGYQNKELSVTAGQAITVQLDSVDNALNDVVVIGYGTQSKRNVTGVISTFNTKQIEEKPIPRVDQAMIGQMPGVTVVQQTGMVGAGMSIQVRGSGSVTAGREPLYVVDGFPLDVASQNSAGGFTANPLNNINPNDIESIDVLKDAAAAAIYGSRGSNGVVLITTKRGKTGSAVISINAYSGVSKVAKKMDVLSAQEWIDQATELANYKWVNSGTGRTADQTNEERRQILGLADGQYNINYMPDDRWSEPGHPGLQYVNWQDEAFRTAPFNNAAISASGGTQTVHYFISGNYLDQNGTLLNSFYKNYSARANVEVNANKHLKLGLDLSPTYSETRNPSAEGKDNVLMKLYNMTPVVEDTAGLYTGAGKNAVYQWASSSVSPVAQLLYSSGLTKVSRTLYSLYGQYTIIDGLYIKSTLNYDDDNSTTDSYSSDFVSGDVTDYLNNPGLKSSGSYAGFRKQNFLNENTINYDFTLKGDHHFSIVAGQSYNWVHLESYSLKTAGGFANDIVKTLSNAIANSNGVTVTGTTSASNSTMLSYYGRVQYDYKGKYLYTASLRRDASSRFGLDSRWGTFPSMSAGWRISQESFMQNVKFVNDLKIRASWGKAGNNNIGDYSAVPTVSSTAYSFGNTAATGFVSSGIPNPNLKWETSNTYDAGLDGSFLRSRIGLTVDYYVRKSTDLLLNIPVPAATGFNTTLENIGAVQNSGLEIGLNTVNISTTNFQWNMNANIAFNQNKVLSLGSNGNLINIASAYGGNPPFLLEVGKPMYSYYLIKTEGILTQADMDDPSVAKLSGETVGDAKYYDKTGDGLITADDRVMAGQPNPKYTWGFTNNFKYKDFDLGIQMYGQHGGHIFSFLARAIDNPANGRNTTLGIWRDRWTEQNQNYNAPRGKIGESYTIPYFTTDWLYSSDFWRIQSITLGYNLQHLLKTKIFNTLRLYASMQNWFEHDKYKGGVNPEAQNTNTSGNGSYPLPGDYGAMPLSKTVTVGLNLTF